MATTNSKKKLIACSPRPLPRPKWVQAAQNAININPLNHAPVHRLMQLIPGFKPQPEHLAVLTNRYWGNAGVKLTVGFLDSPPADLCARIISHMNAWTETANVEFVASNDSPDVRIARVEGGDAGGYWSYLGTDIKTIDANSQTMNLEGFTMDTDESEFHRVVRHETGHTLGFPHEHMRRELVDLIDPDKAIEYFGRTQGWNADQVRAQVLTPIEESSLWGTEHADPNSIMCYQIPGEVTKSGDPIPGGLDIDEQDYAFAAQVYPK
jgi:hypothetical protein